MTIPATPTAPEPRPRPARQEICSMERHDMRTRAVRYLLGAGTMAAALIAATAAQASAQTNVCFGEAPIVCGHVFTETTPGDDTFQEGEGTDYNVTVVLTDPMGNVVATFQENPQTPGDCVDPNQLGCGYYEFGVETPGDYKVCVVIDGQPTDCRDVPSGSVSQFEDFEVPNGEEPPADVWGVGTGTPGYWKNHPEAWPADGVTVGGILYKGPTIQNAIKLMGKVGGDKSLTMFASLISAKLNTILQNNPVCISATIDLADQWMVAHPAGSGVKASSAAWLEGEPWHTKMDDYNNGKLCAPHRD
jgi:hypothetical protein